MLILNLPQWIAMVHTSITEITPTTAASKCENNYEDFYETRRSPANKEIMVINVDFNFATSTSITEITPTTAASRCGQQHLPSRVMVMVRCLSACRTLM